MISEKDLIVDESKIIIEHDDIYQLIISINKSNRIKNKFINIPVSIPIYKRNINERLYKVNKAIFETFLSSILLARLGIPKRKRQINVYITGTLPHYIKNDLENILKYFIVSRTLAANQRQKIFSINIIADNIVNNKFNSILNNKKNVVLCFSGGEDSSTILNFLIKNKYRVFPYFFEYESLSCKSDVHKDKDARDRILDYFSIKNGNLFIKIYLDEIKDKIPWNTKMYEYPYSKDPNVQDRDEWYYYGRNALMAAVCLLLSIQNRAKYIEIGHTIEGVFSVFRKNNIIMYDRCCSSLYFLNSFNNVLKKIFGENSPLLISSLINMGKGSIGRYLLKQDDILSKTHSCIEPFNIECGQCFSCSDKLSSILSNVNPFSLKVIKNKKYFEIIYENKLLAKFQWVPRKYNSGTWGKQLERFKNHYPNIPHDLKNSIYSPYAIISSYYNLSKNSKLEEYIPIEYNKLTDNNKINLKIIKKIYEYYTKEKEPLLPSRFVNANKNILGCT